MNSIKNKIGVIFTMKIKFAVLILGIFSVFTSSCFSQVSNEEIYLKENFSTIDSLCRNEMELVCTVYSSKIRKSLMMQVCYWDSLKTKIASKHFKENNKYNGPCYYWAPEGYLTMKGFYVDDKKNGKWYYYLEKTISSEGEYKGGRKIGIWKEYKNGKFERKINYGN